jgi:aminoglycoside phosphotransferase family enzyme
MKNALTEEVIKNYLESKSGKNAEVLNFSFIGEGYYANGYRVVYRVGKEIKTEFIRVIKSLNSGHEYPIDRAREMIAGKEIADNIASAPKVYDVVGFNEKGEAHSAAEMIEYFSIGEYIDGTKLYTADLENIVKKGKTDKDDIGRCLELSNYLAGVHKNKFLVGVNYPAEKIDTAKSLYKRVMREVISHNELTLGVLDFDWEEKDWGVTRKELYGFLADALVYKESLKGNYGRLGRIHGDFWDKNILFKDNKLIASDTSRFIWGEPAIDVAGLVARFMNFDLVNFGTLEGPFSNLTKVFIENYLEKTKDTDILRVMPYVFSFYVIVSSHPAFHPELSRENRKNWIKIGQDMLSRGEFALKK